MCTNVIWAHNELPYVVHIVIHHMSFITSCVIMHSYTIIIFLVQQNIAPCSVMMYYNMYYQTALHILHFIYISVYLHIYIILRSVFMCSIRLRSISFICCFVPAQEYVWGNNVQKHIARPRLCYVLCICSFRFH